MIRNLRSVSSDGRIDLCRPRLNAAGQRLRLLKSLVAKPCGYIQRPLPMMAKNNDAFIRIEFLVGATGNITHGHQQAAGNVRRFKLPWLAYVDEPSFVFFEQRCGFRRRNFVIQHGFQSTAGPVIAAIERQPEA